MKKWFSQCKIKNIIIAVISTIITAIVAKIIYVYFNEYTAGVISVIGSIIFAASLWLSIPFTKLIMFIFTPYVYKGNKED